MAQAKSLEVRDKTVPKMTLVAPPRHGGAVTTRVFIPHRAHASIGVLGAVTAATACLIPGSPAAAVSKVPQGARKTLSIEHPTGEMSCVLDVDEDGTVTRTALLRVELDQRSDEVLPFFGIRLQLHRDLQSFCVDTALVQMGRHEPKGLVIHLIDF